jgi:hypothetical protein
LIGNFRFVDHPSDQDVALELMFSSSGERLGFLHFGEDIRLGLDQIGFPAKEEVLPLETALGYAIAVAMRANRSLTLTGDPSVWNPEWGMLRAPDTVSSSV